MMAPLKASVNHMRIILFNPLDHDFFELGKTVNLSELRIKYIRNNISEFIDKLIKSNIMPAANRSVYAIGFPHRENFLAKEDR